MEILLEDAGACHKKKLENEGKMLKLRVQLSQLNAQNAEAEQEYKRLTSENDSLLASNDELGKKNWNLKKEIDILIKRVDLNTLLKEIDIEELMLLKKNNDTIQRDFIRVLQRWDHLQEATDKLD